MHFERSFLCRLPIYFSVCSEVKLKFWDAVVYSSRDDRVWLMSGSKDTVVKPGVVQKLELFYKHFVDPDNIKVQPVVE